MGNPRRIGTENNLCLSFSKDKLPHGLCYSADPCIPFASLRCLYVSSFEVQRHRAEHRSIIVRTSCREQEKAVSILQFAFSLLRDRCEQSTLLKNTADVVDNQQFHLTLQADRANISFEYEVEDWRKIQIPRICLPLSQTFRYQYAASEKYWYSG